MRRFQPIDDWARRHPDLAEVALGVAVALGLLAVSISQWGVTHDGVSRGISLGLTLAVLVDATIVRQNVTRATQGKGLDVPYLASLSPDSVPALAALYQSPALPGLTRDALGAVLICRQQFVPAPRMGDGRSFNLSRYRADQAMASLQPRLKAYQVSLSDTGVKILTPAHVYYECP